MSVFAFGFSPSFPELLIVACVALLLFGKRLPEVARSLGKGIVEFKKGVRGMEDDVDRAVYTPPPSRPLPEDEDVEMTAPKFEPPQSSPTTEGDDEQQHA